jgi:UDP-N-acetylmuramate--alanine ligase
MKAFGGAQHIHIVGAGGIGLSALAKLFVKNGKRITASDLAENEATAELVGLDVPVAIGTEASWVPADAELLVHSDAVPETDPQRAEAKRRGLPQMTYVDCLAELSKEYRLVAVSGTNGKSTTTAMLGLILIEAGLDPTVIVGTKVPQFPDRNLRIGGSDLLVVEACEHNANMLKLHPQMIVLTNVEEDHLDFYRDLAHIRETFQSYVRRLPPDGLLVLNADDHVSFTEIVPSTSFVTYGVDGRADYVARRIVTQEGRQTFYIDHDSGSGATHLPVVLWKPGRFNVYNALAAASAAYELGAPREAIALALANYTGLWRRFERIGEWRGAAVISDYAHHPTGVRETVAGAKEHAPGSRIVLVFQPHHRNRTRRLFTEFVASFDGVDVVLIPEIYDVAGRDNPEDAEVSSAKLVEAIRERDAAHGVARVVEAVGSVEDAVPLLERHVQEGDLVLLMGAGNVDTLRHVLKD